MKKDDKKIGIFGIGGFGREVLCCILDSHKQFQNKPSDYIDFFVSDQYYKERDVLGIRVLKESEFNPDTHKLIIAVGDTQLRRQIVQRFPDNTEYAKIIHPSAVISKWIEIGDGSIITAGVILTCQIKIGKHAHLNLHTTVGHDCTIGDYLTAAPGAKISGGCHISDNVYLGSNCVIKDKVSIVENVIIGMGGVVTKDIIDSGVYVGSPAKKIR